MRSRPPLHFPVVLLLAVLVCWPRTALADGAPSGPDATWPLQPRPTLLAGFAPPSTPYGPGHRGVDLLGRPGQTVLTSRSGTVAFAGRLAGRGVVVVRHGSVRTTYEPVAASVRVGEDLAAGEPIGRLELAASHCWPRACLHWGLKRDDAYLDPLDLVGGGPVRLLPLDAAPSVSFSPRTGLPPLGTALAEGSTEKPSSTAARAARVGLAAGAWLTAR